MKKSYKILTVLISTSMLLSPLSVLALSKDETVYSTAKDNGTISKTIVSDHLINDEKSKTITDKSNLTDIKNVNGNELFNQNGNTLTWSAKGNDIYYQGNTSSSLPISTKVSYSLDGKEMSPSKMKNKKGHVVITINYTNNSSSYMNGSKLYTPFVVDTTTMLESKYNSNISVTSGKVISTGTRDIISAISAPGLYETLDLEALKDLDSVTISYDTTKFSTSTIYSVYSAKLLDTSDIKDLDKVDEIYNKVDELSNASKEIQTGSLALLDGANKLNSGSKELSKGTSAALSGLTLIENGINKNINTLSTKTLTAQEVNDIYTKAQAQVDAMFTNAYKDSIGKKAVANLMADSSYTDIQTEIDAIDAKVKAATNNQLDIVTLYNNCSTTPVTAGYETYCVNFKDAISGYTTYKGIEKAMTGTAYNVAIGVAYQTASDTAKNTAFETTKTVASSATSETVTALKQLSSSLEQLSSGMTTINTGANSLSSGLDDLTSGANTLNSGITTFNEQGINKITDFINNTLKTKTTKIKNLAKLSNDYDTFTLKDNNIDGTTKFITIIK